MRAQRVQQQAFHTSQCLAVEFKLLQTSSEIKTILQKFQLQQFIKVHYSVEGKNTTANNNITSR